MAFMKKSFTSKNTEGKNSKFFPPKKAVPFKKGQVSGSKYPAKKSFPKKSNFK